MDASGAGGQGLVIDDRGDDGEKADREFPRAQFRCGGETGGRWLLVRLRLGGAFATNASTSSAIFVTLPEDIKSSVRPDPAGGQIRGDDRRRRDGAGAEPGVIGDPSLQR